MHDVAWLGPFRTLQFPHATSANHRRPFERKLTSPQRRKIVRATCLIQPRLQRRLERRFEVDSLFVGRRLLLSGQWKSPTDKRYQQGYGQAP